ncbi:MAG TPA: hypothetical protein VF466_00975, partial [Candidatus Saccharimonadales bacterium]
ATTAARSDHTHGTPSLTSFTAPMLGFKLESLPLYAAATQQNAAAGTMLAILVRPGAITISSLGLWVITAGVTSSGVNGMALYSADGQTLIDQTGDMTAAFGGTGFISGNLSSSHTLADSTNYYLAVLTHFSGTIPRIGSSATFAGNIPAINGNIPSLFLTSQASFPSSFTPGSASKNSAIYWMVGF